MGRFDRALSFLGLKQTPRVETTPPPVAPAPTPLSEDEAHVQKLALKMAKIPGVKLDTRTHDEIVDDNIQSVRDTHQGNSPI
jgi:hypothetical protein